MEPLALRELAACCGSASSKGVIVVARADAARPGECRRLLDWAREHLPAGPIAVEAAAGVSGLSRVADLSEEALWEVAGAKVVPAAELLSSSSSPLSPPPPPLSSSPLPLSPSFSSFAAFSSTSGAWSQQGAGHYAAANA